jgi:hypothetical protein
MFYNPLSSQSRPVSYIGASLTVTNWACQTAPPFLNNDSAKYDAWMRNKGIPSDKCKIRYINELRSLDPKWVPAVSSAATEAEAATAPAEEILKVCM